MHIHVQTLSLKSKYTQKANLYFVLAWFGYSNKSNKIVSHVCECLDGYRKFDFFVLPLGSKHCCTVVAVYFVLSMLSMLSRKSTLCSGELMASPVKIVAFLLANNIRFFISGLHYENALMQ